MQVKMKDTLATFFNNTHHPMADRSRNPLSFRRALAMGRIQVGEVGFSQIKNRSLPNHPDENKVVQPSAGVEVDLDEEVLA
jgi:hypothetical protein